MAERSLIGKDMWVFIQDGANLIPIKCLTTHSVTASQEVSVTQTKCGTKTTLQGDPAYQVTGEGLIQLIDGVSITATASLARLFQLQAAKTRIEFTVGPASGTPVPGDITYTGFGYISQLDSEYPAAEDSTFSFTIDVDGIMTQEVEPAP